MLAVSGRLMCPIRAGLFLWLCLTLAALAGCAKSGPPEFEPVELELVFAAGKDMNPNPKGRPSPVAVKVFELKSTTAFDEADYFSLQTEPKAVLADELAGTLDSFVIRPGGRKEIRKPAKPETTSLGIIAGYRDMAGATWQGVHPLPMPPEVGMFTSPVKVRLLIELLESDMQILPKKEWN